MESISLMISAAFPASEVQGPGVFYGGEMRSVRGLVPETQQKVLDHAGIVQEAVIALTDAVRSRERAVVRFV